MNSKLDIIDRLDGEEGYVRLVLKSGVVFGMPLCITYLDDENEMPIIKRILFKPYYSPYTRDYGLDEIISYEPVEKDKIPRQI